MPPKNLKFHFYLVADAGHIRRLTADESGGYRRSMSEASAIETASRRLALALDALAAAVERRRETDRGEEALAAQLHALGTDRSRLAADLDAAAARARALDNTNREVAERLDAAIETIRSLIPAHER
jgi:hypothetical protein